MKRPSRWLIAVFGVVSAGIVVALLVARFGLPVVPHTVEGIDPAASTPPPVAPPAQRWTPTAGAVYVAPTPSSDPDGSRARPYGSITEAATRAGAGGTVVLAGGEYHESVHVADTPGLTVRAAPGATVWLDGSSAAGVVMGRDGRWVLPDQAPPLDRSPTYQRGAPDNTKQGWRFVSSDHPLAADPSQVWLDGTPLRQVSPAGEVTSGTFGIDGRDIVLADDPRGREVRIGVLPHALVVNAPDVSIIGIGIRRYVPSVPDFGAVVLGAGTTLQDVVVTGASTTGVSVQGERVTLNNVVVTGAGMLGLHAYRAHGLRVIGGRFDHNNRLAFNLAPVAGGMKITGSTDVLIRGAEVSHNLGTGVWLDEGVASSRIADVQAVGNSLYGALLELSADIGVVGCTFTGNDGSGLRLQNTSGAAIWNITSSGNRRAVDFVQDGRTAGAPEAPPKPQDPRIPEMPWRIGGSEVANSVLGPSTGDADIAVEDFTRSLDADKIGIRLASNVYRRDGRTGAPRWTHVWSTPGTDPRVYSSVAAFAAAHRQDVDSVQTASGQRAPMPPAQPLPASLRAVTSLPYTPGPGSGQ